ncbi:MetQ/NlpA family ABC transporter substrate-binding protein, partial [Weissella soli]
MKNVFKSGLVMAAAGLLGSVALPSAVASADTVVKVGLVGTSDAKLWKSVAKTAKNKYDITIKVKVFTDYNQPNQALKDGSLDLNAFQHYYFLNNWNAKNGKALKAIGKTFITPIRLYSTDA